MSQMAIAAMQKVQKLIATGPMGESYRGYRDR